MTLHKRRKWGAILGSVLVLRPIVLVTAMAMTYWMPAFASAAGVTRVIGGGTGSFGADLDGDGRIDGSQFGMEVAILGNGAASGHFLCLMAGRSEILGLHLMSVQGQVSGGVLNADGSAMLSGTAAVNLGDGTIFGGVPFTVSVRPGGPGSGTLQLTVVGSFDGVAGDTAPGNSNYDLPTETVRSGQIAIAYPG
jgi:hypothetical protein